MGSSASKPFSWLLRRLSETLYLKSEILLLAAECRTSKTFEHHHLILKKDVFIRDEGLQSMMESHRYWNWAELERRQAAGDLCYQAWEHSNCVHITWVSRKKLSITEIGFEMRLDEGDRWAYDGYTRPAYRGRGFFSTVLKFIVADATKDGASLVWIGVRTDNPASIEAIRNAGFLDVAVLSRRTVFSTFHRRIRRTLLNEAFRDRLTGAV